MLDFHFVLGALVIIFFFLIANEEVDDEDDYEDERCFSPRTRMSITGIRPSDLTSSEDEDEDDTTNDSSKNNSNDDDDLEASVVSFIQFFLSIIKIFKES